MNQSSCNLLMVRPSVAFSNPETAQSNSFQQANASASGPENLTKVLKEFDAFVADLRKKNVNVRVVEDSPEPPKPDAIFPNNWFSTDPEGRMFLFPMLSPLRRAERRPEIRKILEQDFELEQVIDLSGPEAQGNFLEGTGSLVLDHLDRVAYACLSPRTDENLARDFCEKVGYELLAFRAFDRNGISVYHTNVAMGIGTDFALVCLEAIQNAMNRQKIADRLRASGRELIEISHSQMEQFAGNILEVRNEFGDVFPVISYTGWRSLSESQQARLKQFGSPITPDLETIESLGGGSARCMLAEIFLPLR